MPSGSWSEFQARPILSANINLFMSMWHGSLLVLLLLPTPCWRPSCRQWEMESQLPSSSRSYFRRRWRRLQIARGRILIILHCFDSNACCSLAGWGRERRMDAAATGQRPLPQRDAPGQRFTGFSSIWIWILTWERRLSPAGGAVWDVIKSSGLIDKHWLFFGHSLFASCLFDFRQVI